MKKTLLLLLFAAFTLSTYAEGISNYKELVTFVNDVNNKANLSKWKNEKGEVCIKADIDMSKAKKLPQIESIDFVIDGCGHKLCNWNAKNALIKRIELTGGLKNITVDNSCVMNVDSRYEPEPVYVSFLVRENFGHIINCVNNGFIEHSGEGLSKSVYIAGIVTINHSLIYNCKNTGKISSNIGTTTITKGLQLRIAGIASLFTGYMDPDVSIVNCENTGLISSISDYNNVHVGGVVGDVGGSAPVKYCVNRGNVAAITTPASGNGFIRIGGIVTWTANDVIGCCNFGTVSSSGSADSYIGGIASSPGYGAQIIGCTNYGKVSANTSATSYTGGMASFCSSELYIHNCINYGEIACLNRGDRLASIGGIIGGLLVAKNIKKATTLYNCINYGKVSSLSKNTSGAIGGIVGLAQQRIVNDRPVVQHIINCSNKGQVICEKNKPGHLVGKPESTVIKGEFRDGWAKYVKPLKDGTNVYGRILDTEGNPIEGVVVSDGEQSVLTDVSGGFAMKSDFEKAHFVQISVPAKYEIETYGNLPQFFLRIPRYAEAVRADFTLKKREEVSDKFTLALIGNPQLNGNEKAATLLRKNILTEIAKLQDNHLYAIALGNLVAGNRKAFPDYVNVIKDAKFPVFNVIGFHDYLQQNTHNSAYGSVVYENFIAPVNYSFNIGKVHFVMVDGSIYNRATERINYERGLEERTCKWLENDLKFVSKDHTIVLCCNTPLFRNTTNFSQTKVNYPIYSKLFTEFNKVYVLSAQENLNYHYNYNNEKLHPYFHHLKNMEVISVARCCGQPILNQELNNSGTPNGYMVMEIDGNNAEWYYKSINHDRNYQMRAYTPAQSKGGWVKVTIWNHSPESWTTPEWWENGVKVADMTRVREKDIAYIKLQSGHIYKKLSKWGRHFVNAVEAPFIFRVKPTEGVKSGEIRVTDTFGVTYTQEVKW